MEKKLRAGFVPNVKNDNFDPRSTGNVNLSDSDNPKLSMQLLKKEDVQNFFSGYFFSIDDDKTQVPRSNSTPYITAKEDLDE